ncbi:MAG: hypothetical protein JKX84_05795 [Flavobacteriales bacterium]|nr:hypothetical protein [Flavobacteriales bacterium]
MRAPLSILIILTLSSCSMNRMFLTVNTKKKIEAAGVNLSQVQFYNSSEIILARGLKQEEVSVAQGKIKIVNGKRIEEIIIPPNTPGICELNNEKTLKVSFDLGEGRSIPFVVEKKNGVIVEESYFKIGAKTWVLSNRGKRVGKIDYQDKTYTLLRGADCRLMIDKSVLNRVKKDTHVARGRKL